jgi:acyl carrier protein
MMTAPSRAEMLREIASILEAHLGLLAPGPIGEETRFFADLGLASIDAVVLGEALQQYYGRPIPFHELMAEMGRRTERDLSIGELVAFLGRHL